MSLDKLATCSTFVELFYSSIDCPRSLTCYLLYKYKEHDQLASLPFNPFDYNDSDAAFDSLSATKFLSKATFLDCSYNLEEVAIEKFKAAEQSCLETNRRLRHHRFDNPMTESVIMTATRKIMLILGKFNPDEFVDACNWGPGATTSIRRRQASSPLKFESETRISSLCYEFVSPWFKAAYPHWDVNFDINGDSKIVTVPKDAKSDRIIAIEPGLNLWFQKGIGSMIRRRLFREGIDLNDQRRNQELAKLGSKFNKLATVDFSSASDTISDLLVRELFSDEWLSVLVKTRSRSGLLHGERVVFHKFSSMGNGYTFELESLIFYAIAHSVCEILRISDPIISVYGDDVIIPVEAIDAFQSVCADLGFTVNRSKSYSSSYYRESCGEHFWNGRRIKPFFQKEPLNEKSKTTILKSANNVRRLAHRYSIYSCDSRFRDCWLYLSKILGSSAPLISDGYGDLGLVCNLDETLANPPVPAKRGYEGYTVRLWSPTVAGIAMDGKGLWLSKLKLAESFRYDSIFDIIFSKDVPVGGNCVPLPGRIKHSKTRMLIHRWYDDGGWI